MWLNGNYVGAESEHRDRIICTKNRWLRNTILSASITAMIKTTTLIDMTKKFVLGNDQTSATTSEKILVIVGITYFPSAQVALRVNMRCQEQRNDSQTEKNRTRHIII